MCMCRVSLSASPALACPQEIVGLGLANFAGSAFNAYSTTGSFSRSAVNYDSGAQGSCIFRDSFMFSNLLVPSGVSCVGPSSAAT